METTTRFSKAAEKRDQLIQRLAVEISSQFTLEQSPYLVGIDFTGRMVVSLDFRDMKGLSDVYTVVASSSDQARSRYNSVKLEDEEGQKYAESFHP